MTPGPTQNPLVVTCLDRDVPPSGFLRPGDDRAEPGGGRDRADRCLGKHRPVRGVLRFRSSQRGDERRGK